MSKRMEKLIDGTMVREEPFGFFLAFPDGYMGFFGPSVEPLLRLAATMPVPKNLFFPHRISQPGEFGNGTPALSQPLIVSLELTTKCNCSCSLCYINAGEPRPHEMTDAQMRALWDRLVDVGVCCVQLTGGEPLLHPLLLEAIRYFHSRGIVISLATNGTLLTEEFIMALPRRDFGIGISVDSSRTNERMRGGPSYFGLLEPKLKLLRDAGIPFNVVPTLSKLNIRDALSLIEWCRRNDMMLETLEALPLGRALSNPHLLLTEDDLPADAVVYRAKEELEDEYESRHPRPARFFSGFLQMCSEYAFMTGRCEGGRAIAYIASDGACYPCSSCASRGILSTGNVTDTPLDRLWREGFREMRSIKWDDFHECSGCALSDAPYRCPYRCPALSHVRTGKFTRPGCSPYAKGAILQRTRIHDEMHAAQMQRNREG